ncbi:hypothetical protein BSY238_816 [Methyloversatilis sp. RAC08]|uniref:hypothetical protein n=1 Tax=Methyloversatilis sp. RAC08 TaxID=1842540 RepID=UPI00083D2497|nr:hypothetical protein [Methyloversatilis sp. RAC08]AOF82293.1 hypothetical protein BSY238_816 [Methyloversatilis sp. RAC08]
MTLTVEKLDVYMQFKGDLDGRTRSAPGASRQALSDDEWYLIDDLLMQLGNVQAGHASAGFIARLEARLQSVTADEATRDALRALARRTI